MYTCMYIHECVCMYVYMCVGTRVVKTTPTTDEKMSTKVEIGVMQKFLVTEVGRNIFVQLDTPEAYQVQDLSREIETHISKVKDTLSTFEPGTRCYARASDGVLYRALIVNRKTSLSATVYFTDYGNSETVEMSSVYPPTGDYFTLPSQALCCLLGDFVPNRSNWTDVISFILVEKLVNQEVYGVFRSHTPIKTLSYRTRRSTRPTT